MDTTDEKRTVRSPMCNGPQCRGKVRWGTALLHTCPFLVDIHDDKRLCNCCKECVRACADEV